MKNNQSDMKRVIEQMEAGRFTLEDGTPPMLFSKSNHRGYWFVSITDPHEGNNYKWLVRANDRETFDKWGNADFQELYDDIDDFMNHVLIDLEEEFGE